MNLRKDILILLIATFQFQYSHCQAKKQNILFIAVDDLRPELGCYGSPIAITPNIDKLSKSGIQFENAYCQIAICSPSRASIMTGARPESIKVVENFTYFRDKNPDIITLPQLLQTHGYETVYTGKIYHGIYTDNEKSWSRVPAKELMTHKYTNYPGGYALKKNQEILIQNKKDMIEKYGAIAAENGLGEGPAYESADVPDNAYEDGYNTDLAITTLKDMIQKNPSKPFFLGLGLKKPHLNWIAPKKYWDLYDPNKIPLTNQPNGPIDGAAMGLHPSFELRVRYGMPKNAPVSDSLAKVLKHAYLACVSYADANIGRMINALESEGVLDNTIIVLWSDHGWHLGDMGIWGKATNYEYATRIPLIVSTPEMRSKKYSKKSNALVELVDVYPTLCDMLDIDKPTHLEGQSFTPIIEKNCKTWKKAVFSQFPTPALREWAANPLSKGMRETYFGELIEKVEDRIITQQKDKWDRDLFENRLMGYAMRTERYRFVVWKDYINPQKPPIFYELYDHKKDPNETKNIADQNPKLIKNLLAQFNKGWEGNKAKI